MNNSKKNNSSTKAKYIKFGLLASIVIPLLAFAYGFIRETNQDKNSVLLQLITYGLNQNHYQPQDINDEFSEKVFNTFIERLDYNKRYLLQSDVDYLAQYKLDIDNQIQNGTYTFFDAADSIINVRQLELAPQYQEILAEPFNFEIDENVEFDAKKISFAQNTAELKERWRKALKYETLSRVATRIKLQEDAKADGSDSVITILPVDSIEISSRSKVKENYDNWYKRIQQVNTEDRREVFLNVITGMYDPHTNYFPPKRKEDYDIGMSGRLEGIGATLQQSDSYIKVVKLQPGSPSWKQGQLKVGDLILKVGQADAEPIDVVDMRLDDAVKLIRGKKGTEVRLTVKKVDGAIKVIPIIRDIVNIDETFAKSSIFKNKGKKFGYIYLPKFYADFEHPNGRNCSDDVEAEITKLKADKVDGIILDLRNNGGGSLQDVVKMTGLFIKKGPVVQVKARNREPQVLSDNDPKIQWEGALVVMVNEMSASASEILAAAIQDYKRGIIIGSKATFGKGSVQRFVDFDQVLNPALESLKPMGAMKMTIQKFYRINGATTQLKGVASDVVLPDSYAYIPLGEVEQENPLQWDEIEAVKYEEWNSPKYSYKKVITAAQKRVNANKIFQLVDKGAKYLKEKRDDTEYTLELKDYLKEERQAEKTTDKFELPKDYKASFTVITPTNDISSLTDSIQIKARNQWNEELTKDIYLEQATEILQHMQ